MRINLTLYNTKLSATDTLYFATKQEQTRYFNSLFEIGYWGGLSYNGTRNIRVTGTVPYLLNTSSANYAKIDYLDETHTNVITTHYCFIDNIVYINDTCYEIELTIDYIQTFLFSPIFAYGDFAIVAENRDFKKPLRRSYGNTMSVAINRENILYNMRQSANAGKYEFVYAVLTIKTKDEEDLFDAMNSGLASYVLPAIIMHSDQSGEFTNSPSIIYILGNVYSKRDGSSSSYKLTNARDFLESEAVQGNYVGLAIVDDIGLKNRFTISREAPSASWNDEESIWIKVNYDDGTLSEVYLPQGMANAFRKSKSGLTYSTSRLIDKPQGLPFFKASPRRSFKIKYDDVQSYFHALRREPYSWIEFRQAGQQPQRISFSDNRRNWTNNEEITEPEIFELVSTFNPLYPNTTTYYLAEGAQLNEIFSVEPSVVNLAFSVDKWAEYYTSNRASVNDGLATKHSYDMEIANNSLATQTAQATLSAGVGIAAAAISGDVGAGVGAAVKGANQLMGSVTSYVNTKTNLEKEKALLELGYQDLKSAPSAVSNQNLNQNSFASILNSGFKIVMVSPNFEEYNTISRYHTIYGFRIEEYTNVKEKFNNSDYITIGELIKPNEELGYKYICMKDLKLQGGLKNVCNIISSIFENGLKIWLRERDLDTSNYPYENYERNKLPIQKISLARL